MANRAPDWIALVTAVGVAAVLSVLAATMDRWPGDLPLTEFIQGWPRWLDPVADGIRLATGTRVVLVTGMVACGGLWLVGERSTAVALAVALVVLPFLQAGLKDIVDRPRPDPELVDYRGTFTSPSFPSGHVMSGTVLFGILTATAFRRGGAWRRAGFALLALLVANGVANVYEGVHWPSDVLGGVAWALVLIMAAEQLRRGMNRRSVRLLARDR